MDIPGDIPGDIPRDILGDIPREPPRIIPRPDIFLGHAITPLRAAIDALDRKDCPSALKYAAIAGQRAGQRDWQQYMRRQTLVVGCADFATIADYIENQGYYESEQSRIALRIEAEKAMRPHHDGERIIAWADQYPPLSGVGAIRHIEALFLLGHSEKASVMVRRYWRMKNFTRGDERIFIRRYRRHWTQADNLQRLDRLLWENRHRAAGRTLMRIKGKERNLPAARLALQAGHGDVDRRIAALTASEKVDEGLRYDRMRWRLRHGRGDGAEFLNPPSKTPQVRSRWWKNRLRVMRQYISRKEFEKAYHLGVSHNLDQGRGFSEIEWLAGWIAFHHLKQPRQAYDHFRALYAYGDTIYHPRAAYWSARACEVVQETDCKNWYHLSARSYHTFYGQRAAQRLALLSPDHRLEDGEPMARGDRTKEKPDVSLTVLLAMLGYTERAGKLLDEQFARARTQEESRSIIALAEHVGLFYRAVQFERQHNKRYYVLSGYGYPDPFFIPPMATIGIEPKMRPLILALIRNESAFRIQASSRVGAGGLMQLMPGTAREVARRLKLPYARQRLRTDAVYNLRLGSVYLQQMLQRYDSFLPLALAAYNAGPRSVDFWIKRLGDPRRRGGQYLADWIESIPFAETRRYVRKVLADVDVYRNQTPPNHIP